MKRLGNDDFLEAFTGLGFGDGSGGFFPAAGKGSGNEQGQGQNQWSFADAVQQRAFVEAFGHRRIHPFGSMILYL
jgi:hypothetical protein